MELVIPLLVTWCAVVTAVRAEVYTSTAQLESILRTEQEVVTLLNAYLKKAQNSMDRIRNYVMEHGNMADEEHHASLASNPLFAYQLMKRLAIDWRYIETEMQNNDWWSTLNEIRERRSVLSMPEESDLQGAALALIRLKHTYHLNVSELSKGILNGMETAQVQLTARDCLYLGRNTLHVGFLDQAIEWLEEAMVLSVREANRTAGQEEIMPYLQEAIARARGNENKRQRSDPGTRNSGESHHQQASKAPAAHNYNAGFEDVKNYDALCRGEAVRPVAYESRLSCFYRTGPHPYLRLRRVPVEQHNLDPPLLTLHDVIYDSEIQLIQTLAKPMLERSTVVGENGVWRQVSDTRTSKNTWIYDWTVQEHLPLRALQRRIQWITGLKAENEQQAEALQVANYGVGGHYVPHYDFLFQNKSEREMAGVDMEDFRLGDRMATLMFYLSDVPQGGATVFPRMGAAIFPRKGSAAFWYNLKRNGSGDLMTLHGACPVLHGSKWVSNKWIRERAQLHTHRCGLSQHE